MEYDELIRSCKISNVPADQPSAFVKVLLCYSDLVMLKDAMCARRRATEASVLEKQVDTQRRYRTSSPAVDDAHRSSFVLL